MATPKVHVKKGDTVVVISGKDAGKKGKVLSIIPEKQRVIVEGVNIVKRHTRPTPKLNKGGILEKEAPLASSKVMLYCQKCNRPVRITRRVLGDGTKVRICKKCGEAID